MTELPLFYRQLRRRMEPETFCSEFEDAYEEYAASIAISLKRIADVLERIYRDWDFGDVTGEERKK
ncbi:MAG: hypothetical protein C5B60_04715 [Chloroflexi bacterium]|nr:MAG: hypothetical protein C5B60_04715 [Chloroflexota bacterium]